MKVALKYGELLAPAEFRRMADEIDEIAGVLENERSEPSLSERLKQFAEQLRQDAEAAALRNPSGGRTFKPDTRRR